jgi:hypothetical protein
MTRFSVFVGAILLSFWAAPQTLADASTDSALSIPRATAGLSTENLEGLDKAQKAEILRLLDSIALPLTSLKGKVWKRRKDTFLALGLDSSSSVDTIWQQYHLFAFDLSRPKIRLSARWDSTELKPNEQLEGLDLAAYQIRPSEYAFGVIYSRWGGGSGGMERMTGITLYRLREAQFEVLFDTPISFGANFVGEWIEDGTREHYYSTVKAVILVTKRKTGGYFDWLLKADNGKSARLFWKEGGYVLQGRHPFPRDKFETIGVEE